MNSEEAEKKSTKKAEGETSAAPRAAKEKPAGAKETQAGGGAQEKKDEKPGAGEPLTKKTRSTNCAFTNERIRRKDWYYRNGLYFASKNAFKEYMKKEREEAGKKKGEAAPAVEPEAKKAEAPKKSEAPAKDTGGT